MESNDQHTSGANRPADKPATLGVPVQEVKDATPVEEAESLLSFSLAEYEKEPRFNMESGEEKRGWSLGGLLKKSGLTSLILGLSALGLLVLASQALSFVSYLAAFPLWLQVIGYVIGGGLSLMAVVCLLRFLRSYFKLEQSPRISLKAMQELSARQQLRQQAAGQLTQARDRLLALLQDYPLDSEAGRAQMAALGFSPENLDLLVRNRRQLLDSAADESCESWLNQFNARFVHLLDQAAKRRITRYAWSVGIKTAAAPTGLVDASIVLLNAYQLIGEMCRIYRLRASGIGTASILFRIFVNAFAAARLEQWMDSSAQQIVDSAAQGADGMAAFFKVISEGLLSRLAEGGANAFLLVRLGAAAMHYLRPIAEKPPKQ